MNKAIDFQAGAGDFSPMYSAAINYVQNGWKITQLSEHGKIPLISDWRSRPVETIEQVETVWGSHPKFNIGLLCANNGLVCVDIDLRKEHEPEDVLDGFQELAILEEHYGFKCESSVIQNSGSGGRHYFFKAPEGISFAGAVINPLTGKKCNKIDIRFNHQIVVEPSIHPSGGMYEWVNGGIIANEPSELPSQLLALIRKDRQQTAISEPNIVKNKIEDEYWDDQYLQALHSIGAQSEGGRNTVLYEQSVHVFSLIKEKRINVGLDQAKAELSAAAFKCGLDESEIGSVLESALKSSTVSMASPEKHEKALSAWLKQKTLERGIQWAHLTEKGKPLDTIENLKALLDFYGINCRYNVIKKEQEIIIPNKQFFADTEANDTLAEIISICKKERFHTSNTDKFLSVICSEQLFNPVITWIQSTPWDGQNRLGHFLKTVSVQEPKILSTGELFHEHLIRKWMVQAIASASSANGMSSIGVLVFSGAQGSGKTSWFRNLIPQNLQEQLVKTEASIDPHNKDDVLESIKYWIVELGELDGTFKKAEIAALKGFITRPKDEVRRPYSPKTNVYGRRTTFCASVNSDSFLIDETGNRRFWTLPTIKTDYEHTFDMQQVWAEVFEQFKKGESFLLDEEASHLLQETNSDHMMADPLADRLETELDWKAHKEQWERKTRGDIFKSLMGREANRFEANRLTNLLKNRGLVCKKSNGTRFYEVPPLKSGIDFA